MPRKKMTSVEISTEDGGTTKIELSLSDLEFANKYLSNGLNATQAYLEIHPDLLDEDKHPNGYDSAKSSASDLLAKPNIQLYIKDRSKKGGMGVEEIVMRISNIARADMYPFIKYMPDGFVYFDLSSPQAKSHMYMIKEMEPKRERRVEGAGEAAEEWEGEWVKVKLHDSYAALRDLAKINKLFVDRTENTQFNVELPWDELSPDQISRLANGESPAKILKEINERKSTTN